MIGFSRGTVRHKSLSRAAGRAIMEAAAAIVPGDRLVIIAPFEPVPLYAVLQGQGFTHQTAQRAACQHT
jgi:uncharacterized protein (DUF2249 family)